jgi:hypothetical protein
MKFLPRAFAAIAAIGVACGAAAANDPAAAMANVSALPAQPSMYSFADVYRLTVAGPATADNPLAALAGAAASDASSARLPKSAASVDYQLRVVSSEAQAPVRQLFPAATAAAPVQSSYMFSIGAMPQPERWLLILSGLAAAAWVARRRLGNSF